MAEVVPSFFIGDKVRFKPGATMKEGFTHPTFWRKKLEVIERFDNGMVRVMNKHGHTLNATPEELEPVV